MLIQHSVKFLLVVQQSVNSTARRLVDIGKYSDGNFEHYHALTLLSFLVSLIFIHPVERLKIASYMALVITIDCQYHESVKFCEQHFTNQPECLYETIEIATVLVAQRLTWGSIIKLCTLRQIGHCYHLSYKKCVHNRDLHVIIIHP